MAFRNTNSAKLSNSSFFSRMRTAHDVRDSLHIKLLSETKRKLKVRSVEMGMPIQQMFECLAHFINDEDPVIIKKLNRYKLDIERGEAVTFSQEDADSLFRAIAEGEDNDCS